MKFNESQNNLFISNDSLASNWINRSVNAWSRLEKTFGFNQEGIGLDYIAWAAAWLFLRWAEHEDAEQEAIALFNGENYTPLFPSHIKWENYKDLQPEDFSHFLESTLIPHIRSLDGRPVAIHLNRMVKYYEPMWFGLPADVSVKSSLHEPPVHFQLISTLWHIVSPLDLGRQEHCNYASNFIDSILYNNIKKARSSEFITPNPVVDLMVELANPQCGESIYDPCFGVGGLLVQAARRIRESAKQSATGEWENLSHNSIFGIEWDETAYTIAIARIVLSGIPKPGLELTNALQRPRSASFDVVLAVPPWGHIDNEIRESLRLSYNVPARDWSNLFVQHIMQALKPGGRAVIAVPEGLLFSSGPDKQLRKWLLNDFKVDGIISLPEGSFAPCTGIKSSLILIRREAPAESVFFCQVQKLAGTAVKTTAKEEKPLEIAKRFHEREVGSNSWSTPVYELMKHNWELVAKKSGDEQMNKWLSEICSSKTEVQRLSLQQIAVVATGIKYDRKIATENQTSEDDFRLIRISDIREGSIVRPSLYIKKSDANQINVDLCVRSHDILLSKTGTIGKTALVNPEAALKNTTATQSLVIIRPNESVLPEYLYALLTSTSYQQWMIGHARGAAIQHLATDSLRHLSIPVPEIQIQDRVIRELKKDKNADPLSVLANIVLNKGTKESKEVKSEIDLATFSSKLLQVVDAADPIERVKQAAGAYSALLTMFVDNDYINYQCSATIADAVEPLLLQVDKYPKGVSLFAILWHTLSSISYLEEHIEFQKPHFDDDEGVVLGEKLISLLSNELRNAMDDLKSSAIVDASISDNIVALGTDTNIEISITNNGYLPLIGCSIEIEPKLFKREINYLAEHSSQNISVTIPKQFSPGKFELSLIWSAKHIDDSDASGTVDLAIEIQSIRDVVHLANLGASPYVTGSPIEVNRPEMFFGRQEIIETIKRQLPTSHRANIILLEGNRRSGKTSILNQLLRPEMLHGWIPVYCNFQGGTGDSKLAGLPTHEIYKLLTKCIFDAVLKSGHRTWFPDMDMPDKTGLLFTADFKKTANSLFVDESAFERFELYLQSVIRIIAPNRLLLMLDEFDKIQEGIDTRITSPQVPENLRYILHTYPETSAILSYSKILRKLRNEYWSMLFGLGHRVTVGALEEEAAKLLVTHPAEGKLVYSDKARNKIIELCANQPFIIQQLCNCIFDKASDNGQRSISESLVDAAAQHLSTESEHFRTLWDHHVGSERRRFVLALCENLMNGPDAITYSLLEKKLLEAGIYAKNLSQALKNDIDHLKDLDLITMHGQGRYSLTIPLMASWIQQNIDFESQKRLAQNESQENL